MLSDPEDEPNLMYIYYIYSDRQTDVYIIYIVTDR